MSCFVNSVSSWESSMFWRSFHSAALSYYLDSVRESLFQSCEITLWAHFSPRWGYLSWQIYFLNHWRLLPVTLVPVHSLNGLTSSLVLPDCRATSIKQSWSSGFSKQLNWSYTCKELQQAFLFGFIRSKETNSSGGKWLPEDSNCGIQSISFDTTHRGLSMTTLAAWNESTVIGAIVLFDWCNCAIYFFFLSWCSGRNYMLKQFTLPALKDRGRWKNDSTSYTYVEMAKSLIV